MDRGSQLDDPGTEADWGCQVSGLPKELKDVTDMAYWLSFEGFGEEAELMRELFEMNQTMLKALQRLTHPAADDQDLEDALELLRQIQGDPQS